MQTDTMMAFQVEPGDTIVSGEFTYLVGGIATDIDEGILFDTTDDDGEQTQLWYPPFESVNIVTSFDDDSVQSIISLLDSNPWDRQ